MKTYVTGVHMIAPNQIEISTVEGVLFYSYGSLIAMLKDGEIYLTDKWDYSQTTLKYLKRFLGDRYKSKKHIEKRIESGEIKMIEG